MKGARDEKVTVSIWVFFMTVLQRGDFAAAPRTRATVADRSVPPAGNGYLGGARQHLTMALKQK